MGGGQETQGGVNNAGAMGIYDPNYSYGNPFDWSAVGKGIAAGGKAYAQGTQPQSQGLRNYQSGSGSPYIGGERTASADEPASYQIQPAPNNVSDFQRQYFDIVNKIYQSYQQRVMNEGFGQGQFGF